MPDGAAEHLCVACGMCCNGSLFNFAKLTELEIASSAPPFEVVEAEGDKGFAQPCPHFVGESGCSVYEVRPATCRRFRCRTLRAMEAGEIDRDEAGRRVAETRQLADTLRPLIADGSIPNERWRMGQAGGVPTSPDEARLRLQMVGLNRLLERWFYNDPKPDA